MEASAKRRRPLFVVRMKALSPGYWWKHASCWRPRVAIPTVILKEAAAAYKVDTEAIALKVARVLREGEG